MNDIKNNIDDDTNIHIDRSSSEFIRCQKIGKEKVERMKKSKNPNHSSSIKRYIELWENSIYCVKDNKNDVHFYIKKEV